MPVGRTMVGMQEAGLWYTGGQNYGRYAGEQDYGMQGGGVFR